mgnify:CR=1 FL=1
MTDINNSFKAYLVKKPKNWDKELDFDKELINNIKELVDKIHKREIND